MTVADPTARNLLAIVTLHIFTGLGMAAKMLGYAVAMTLRNSAVIFGQ